jgi:hypothetical protein
VSKQTNQKRNVEKMANAKDLAKQKNQLRKRNVTRIMLKVAKNPEKVEGEEVVKEVKSI